MHRIEISDGAGNSVALLSDIEYTIVPEEIGSSATMASGREVFDFIGEKNTLTIPTGWLRVEQLVVLRDMIRRKHILNIRYSTPEGERTERFLVRQPTLKLFRYDNDTTVWYGVTLTAVQYEVTEAAV